MKMQDDAIMSGSVRRPVVTFAIKMESVLRANDHKGGWTGCAPQWLLMRLKQEVAELEFAMKYHSVESGSAIKECADVANFAMMIADNMGLGYQSARACSPPETDLSPEDAIRRGR